MILQKHKKSVKSWLASHVPFLVWLGVLLLWLFQLTANWQVAEWFGVRIPGVHIPLCRGNLISAK